jgi:hypothetical protein
VCGRLLPEQVEVAAVHCVVAYRPVPANELHVAGLACAVVDEGAVFVVFVVVAVPSPASPVTRKTHGAPLG